MPTRYVWLAAQDFTQALGSGVLATKGSAAAVNQAAVWTFPSGSTGVVTANLILPSDWDGGAVTVVLHWSRDAGTNGTVDWEWVWALVAAGDQVDEGGSVVKPGSPPTGPGTAENLLRTTLGSFTPSDYRTIRGAIRRQTGGFAADAWLVGVELQYTATS